MAKFDNTKQHRSKLNNVLQETGAAVTIAGVSGQEFTVASKLRKVKSGSGVMEADAMVAVATPGIVSNGQVVFARLGPISTSADTITYTLFGY